MKVLVTGGEGFVGSAVRRGLKEVDGVDVVCSVRRSTRFTDANGSAINVGDLSGHINWTSALAGVDVVVHTAARVHLIRDPAVDPLWAFRRINLLGTVRLATQAAAAGVQRLVFISSIKVNGETTRPGHPFTADDKPAPGDAYALSKMETENALRTMAAQTGMEVVIIRPPLVYGPGVRANFRTMMDWLSRGIPLPLGAVHNKRSLVAMDNLVDFVVTCVDHPGAANQTFLVSDGDDMSTPQLLHRMGAALAVPVRLIPVPPALIRLGAKLVGRNALADRLCGSLQIDLNNTRRLTGWSPPVSVGEGLRRAAEGYLRETSI
jgi:nucleoside-diphosphate-sugar epimerase